MCLRVYKPIRGWEDPHSPVAMTSYFLAFSWEEFAWAAALASVVGLITLLGLSAFLILNTVQAVPIACPAASRPSFVTLAASSPYLIFWPKETMKRKGQVNHAYYIIHQWMLMMLLAIINHMQPVELGLSPKSPTKLWTKLTNHKKLLVW